MTKDEIAKRSHELVREQLHLQAQCGATGHNFYSATLGQQMDKCQVCDYPRRDPSEETDQVWPFPKS